MIEYFTGQSCGFCPQGTQAVEALRFGHEDRIICVTHHSFNYDDFCTEPSLQYYGFFHRTDAMEAPIMMINRTTHHLEFESTEGFQSMDGRFGAKKTMKRIKSVFMDLFLKDLCYNVSMARLAPWKMRKQAWHTINEKNRST